MRLLALVAALAWGGAVAPSGPADARVTLKWRYRALPARMRVFALAEGAERKLWEMGTAAQLAELPLGAELTGKEIELRRGEARMLVLVMENATAKELSFFAAPHAMNPPERSLGCEFWCLCVDEVYRVPAGRVWYRIVRLGLKDKAVGGTLVIAHDLVGGKPPQTGF